VLVLALVFALHMLFAMVLWSGMRPPAPVKSEQTMIVRLLEDTSMPRAVPPPAPPTLPELVSPQQAAAPRVRPESHEKPRRDAMVAQDHEAAPVPAAPVATPAAISLFAKDGSIRLPPAPTDTSAAASVEAKPDKPADDRQIMQHDSNRMHYKATRFEKYFPPPNETAGGAVGRHIGDAIHEMAKSMCDPEKRSTASNLLCDTPPTPPSPKNADERLNLPPPSLVGDPPPNTLPLETCIAEYDDGKPLSYGCPVNTPDLAFQAEMRVCIDLFRAGRRLKPWCPADTPQRAAAE
jgi:hypothetical protein